MNTVPVSKEDILRNKPDIVLWLWKEFKRKKGYHMPKRYIQEFYFDILTFEEQSSLMTLWNNSLTGKEKK